MVYEIAASRSVLSSTNSLNYHVIPVSFRATAGRWPVIVARSRTAPSIMISMDAIDYEVRRALSLGP